MYKFLATRIHDGYLTWEELSETKTSTFVEKVRQAYVEKYGLIELDSHNI